MATIGLGYTTRHERQFLDKIGTYCGTSSPRYLLIKSYIKAAEKRYDWGLIDKANVIRHAEKLLKKLEH